MKGICFLEFFFPKVVAEGKTMTRRTVKIPEGFHYERSGPNGPPQGPSVIVINDTYDRKLIYPRYRVGETVFLKEPYFVWEPEHCESMSKRFAYKYWDKPDNKMNTKIQEEFRKEEFEAGYDTYYWHNKLFQPERAARYFIKITGVGVERAHSISEADVKAEGLQSRGEFENWWIKINGFSSWAPNPWVWVYQFELINKP